MNVESRKLMDLLRGGRISKPPLWEVWFQKYKYCEKKFGSYQDVENRIKLAKDLGMSAVLLGDVDTNTTFDSHNQAADGTYHYSGGLLTSYKQIEQMPLPDWDAITLSLQHNQQVIHKSGFASWIILPWCFHRIATSMGLENFAYGVYDEPDFINQAFEWVEHRNRLAIDLVIKKVRPDFVLFDGDCAYKNGLMIKPDVFRDLVFERTHKTVSKLKELKTPYTFHSDGKLDEVIPLLVELGFSAVHGCEKAANDMEHLVEAFGNDIVLVGNMDVVFLANATPEQVKKETQKMLKIGSRKSRFVAACNTSPQDYIPDENYSAMCETIRDFVS